MQMPWSHPTACKRTYDLAVTSRPRAARPRSPWRGCPARCSHTQQTATQPRRTVGVHVAAVPLVGPFEAAERALGRLYPDQLALHTVVILEEPDGSCTAFDFLPLQPTLPLTVSR